MQLHYFDDVADFRAETQDWLGYILKVSQAGPARLRVNSARNWHLRVDLDDSPLLWANMPELDYQRLCLYRCLPEMLNLFPAIPASLLQRALALDEVARRVHYLRWFARNLQTQPNLCLRDGNWVLHSYTELPGRMHYLGRYRQQDWQAPKSARDDEFAKAALLELDWASCGSGAIVALKAPGRPDNGRLKWWRKQARLGILPPLLLWRVAALDVCLILDGHLRLQACLDEGVAPGYLLLDSFLEQHYPLDLRAASQIERQVELHTERVQQGLMQPESLVKIQSHLANAYDDRAVRRFVSYARAGLSEARWQQQVDEFMQAHQTSHWFRLD